MNKILVLGDIHGKTIWKDIINKENPDFIIFLGDYVSTHDNISAKQQVNNLLDILKYKEDNLSKVILLRGNHDIQHLGYSWAECSGLFKKVLCEMSRIRNRFLEDTQWIYAKDNIIFSHAGVSQVWLDNQRITNINSVPPCESFGFIPDNVNDYCGTSVTQSPTWIRPNSLKECAVKGYTQVVGHTPMKHITTIKSINGDDIYLCDSLDNQEYLIIEDNNFIIKNLNDENTSN